MFIIPGQTVQAAAPPGIEAPVAVISLSIAAMKSGSSASAET